MRKHSTFRPLVMDSLEDRVVLSHVSVTAKAAAEHHTALSPQTVAADKLMVAYNNFIGNFNLSFSNDIEGPEANGSESDFTDFRAQFAQELKALEKGAVKSLGTEAAGATVVNTVRQAIDGTTPTSLRTQMANLTIAGLDNGSVMTTYQSKALTVIQQNYTLVKQDVLAAVSAATTSASTSSTSS